MHTELTIETSANVVENFNAPSLLAQKILRISQDRSSISTQESSKRQKQRHSELHVRIWYRFRTNAFEDACAYSICWIPRLFYLVKDGELDHWLLWSSRTIHHFLKKRKAGVSVVIRADCSYFSKKLLIWQYAILDRICSSILNF